MALARYPWNCRLLSGTGASWKYLQVLCFTPLHTAGQPIAKTGWCGVLKLSSFVSKQDKLTCIVCSRAPCGSRPSVALLKSTLTGLLPILYLSSPLPFWLLLEAVSQEIICIQIFGSGPASSRSRSVTLTDSSGNENGIHTCRQLRIPRKPHCVSTRIICSLLSENSKKEEVAHGGRKAFSWACVWQR